MPLAVPVPYSWSVGDPITAALLNAQIRDALTFLLNPPLCELIQASTTTTLANSTWTSIAFADSGSSIQADTYGGFSTGANTRYTAQVAGWYTVCGSISYNSSAVGARAAAIYKNGSPLLGHSQIATNAAAALTVLATPTRDVFLNVGDYIELKGWQSSGGNLTTFINGDQSSGLYLRWSHA